MRHPANGGPFGAFVLAGVLLAIVAYIACTRAPGTVRVATSTTGEEIDSDGYTVVLDEDSAELIGVTDTLTISNLAAGYHTVLLEDVQENCTVAGNPLAVTVGVGDTAAVTFAVTCAATVGATASKATPDVPDTVPTGATAQQRRP
jgi:hypothetical protein